MPQYRIQAGAIEQKYIDLLEELIIDLRNKEYDNDEVISRLNQLIGYLISQTGATEL